jgi:hypothetical protein
MFEPILRMLPGPQLRLWDELGQLPGGFVLYGGTALTLRLGHRRSLDFDFFSSAPFDPGILLRTVTFLKGGVTQQSAPNTLTCLLDRRGEVAVSFFGGLSMRHVGEPQRASGNGVCVASLLDIAATKMVTVQHRAEAKDYQDIAALLGAGVALEQAIAAARAVYGDEYNALLSLKSLSYFEDGDLATLPAPVKSTLTNAVRSVDLSSLPAFAASPGLGAPEGP